MRPDFPFPDKRLGRRVVAAAYLAGAMVWSVTLCLLVVLS